jgi:hypothetical protein
MSAEILINCNIQDKALKNVGIISPLGARRLPTARSAPEGTAYRSTDARYSLKASGHHFRTGNVNVSAGILTLPPVSAAPKVGIISVSERGNPHVPDFYRTTMIVLGVTQVILAIIAMH